MKIGKYLMKYAKEKSGGVNCNNANCSFYDNSGKYMQDCSAGTRDDDTLVPYCNNFIPQGGLK